MGRPEIPRDVMEAVETAWARDPNQSAAEVHKQVIRLKGGRAISLRKVQQRVAELKALGLPLFESRRWHPWELDEAGSERYSSEDLAYLFKIQGASLRLAHRDPMAHEAAWALRLRASTEHLDHDLRMFVIWEYAFRQELGHNLGSPRPTHDLDGMLAYRPWLSDQHREDYLHDLAHSGALSMPTCSVVGGVTDRKLRERIFEGLVGIWLIATRSEDLEASPPSELEPESILEEPAVTLRGNRALAETRR